MEKKHAGGRPRLFKTPDELNSKIEEYKTYLMQYDKPPTIAGLAYYTGIDRQTLYNYKKRDEYFDTIKTFVQWILMNWEELGITKGNSGIIFLLKNYGYTDKQEITNNNNNINKNYNMTDEELNEELKKFN